MNEKVKDNTCLQPLIIVPSMLGLQAIACIRCRLFVKGSSLRSPAWPLSCEAEESETSVMDAWPLQNEFASFVLLSVEF